MLAVYQDADQEDIVHQRNQANREAADQGDKWDMDGMTVLLRLSLSGVGVGTSGAEQLLLAAKTTPGDRVVVSPLYTFDERLPPDERRTRQPSPEQLLYAARAELLRIGSEGQGGLIWITVRMRDNPAQVDDYLYPSSLARPFYDGERITLDPDPNDGFGQQQAATVRDITLTLDKAKSGYHIIANYLRRAFYAAEGVPLFSTRTDTLPTWDWSDPFVAAALAPDSPLVLILHDETTSERTNRFEADLLAPLLGSITSWNEEAATVTSSVSVGVVATHRAQRSLLAARFPLFAAGIGTVDAMQGAEFDVTFLSCTESDADYIGATGGFVQAPQRLNVAISRARKKAVVIASRSVLLAMTATDASADGKVSPGFMAFQALRQICDKLLWSGQRDGRHAEVWGS